MTTSRIVAVFLLSLLLCPAQAQQHVELSPVEGLKIGKIRYFPAATHRNEALESAITKAFEIGSKQEVRYLYNRISLTEGGQQALVLLPGAEFSGSGGSSGAVFDLRDGEYRLVTRFTLLRNPIVVSPRTSAGWHDLIMRPSGGGMPAQFSRLRFDGSGYPENPTSLPAMPKGTVIEGSAYLATPISPSAGLSYTTP